MSETITEAAEIEVDDSQNQIVVFMLGNERFSLPMSCVKEIIRPPKTVKVPLASGYLVGLSNLRGQVLPIFDTHRLLGLQSASLSEASRALVIQSSSESKATALLVDKVLCVQTYNPDDVDWDTSGISSDVQASWLLGLVRQDKELTMLMDVVYLTEQLTHVGGIKKGSGGRQADATDWQDNNDLEITDESQLVTFELGEQVYGLPIDRVREIVHCPSQLTEVPDAIPALLGVMTLREKLLPLLSLRSLFHMEQGERNSSSRVVVLEMGETRSIGIVIDKMREVLTVDNRDIEDVPEMIRHRVRFLEKLCRPGQGKQVISLLDLQALFSDVGQLALDNASAVLEEQVQDLEDTDVSVDSDDDSQWIVFKLGKEEFGVPITSVQEIVRVPEKLNKVPRTPDFLQGVMNLRGQVLPVIDQRTRMGMEASDRSDRQRIMVYNLNGVKAGFVVDSVSQVLRIPVECIEASPSDSDISPGLVQKVANLVDAERMIMMIDPNQLLGKSEKAAVLEVADKKSSAPKSQVSAVQKDTELDGSVEPESPAQNVDEGIEQTAE